MLLVCVRLSNVSFIPNFGTKVFSATLISIIPSTFPSKHFGAMLLPTSDLGDTVRSQARAFGICDEKNGAGTGCSPVIQFPLSVSFHQCSILIHTTTTDAV